MKKNSLWRRGLLLLLCTVMTLTFSLSSCNGEEEAPDATDGEETVEVLRLTKDIAVGDKITSAKFEKVSLPESLIWVGALTDTEAVLGKYSLVELSAGGFLVESYLSDKKPNEEEKKENANVDVSGIDRGFGNYGFVVITDYVRANTGVDISREIQKVINDNPQSVIYFPDGEYVISSPISTPANGDVSVSLKLADNAVIKASSSWESKEGMIRLGGISERNDINVPGSNYYLEGGIIDGSGKAIGVSIDHGRETSVRDVTIIDTTTGLRIKRGANNGSSDVDIENLRIVGNCTLSSIGVDIQGWDNTFSNIRITGVGTGMKIQTSANLIRDVYVSFANEGKLSSGYRSCVGFLDMGNRNWYDNCTSEGFATAFEIRSNSSVLTSCVATWEGRENSSQVFISAPRGWNSIARSCAAYFTATSDKCEYLLVSGGEGKGQIIYPIFNPQGVKSEAYKSYLRGDVISD